MCFCDLLLDVAFLTGIRSCCVLACVLISRFYNFLTSASSLCNTTG